MVDKIYKYSPVFIQNLLITLYGYYWKNRRYGADFDTLVKQWKQREHFTKEEWKTYQTTELRKLLVHAFENVPFYRDLYSSKGFKKEDFLSFEIEDLKKLPYLEKEDLRKFGQTTLLAKNRKKGRFYASSGSTGTPVNIYMSKDFHRNWFAAYEARVRNWAGVTYKTSRGMIGGRKVLANYNSKPPFYRFNKAENQTYFSAYHISEKNVDNYVKGITDNKVEYMVGYAQSNYFLADLIVKNNLNVPKLKAVLTSSEKLTPAMRKTFEKAYQCKTFDAYSGIEACGLISENKEGDFLFSPDTGILEIIDANGNDVRFGEEGEIISTGLLNLDQPLIRYRIGDRAKLSENQTTKSGLEMPKIDEIVGRIEDVVYTEDGKKMVRFHSVFLDIKGLKLSQLIQESIKDFTVNLVVDFNEYDHSSELVLLERMKSQLGNNISVMFKYVDDIEKNKNGKYKSVVSKIKK